MRKALIIGSGAIGRFITYFLRDDIEKYFLGRDDLFDNLPNRVFILNPIKDGYEVLSSGNFAKHNSISSYDICFISVRDVDLEHTILEHERIIRNSSIIFLISNTLSSRICLKGIFTDKKINLIFVENGVSIIAYNLLQLINSLKLLRVISDDNFKSNENLLNIFKSDLFEAKSIKDKNINTWLFERYFKTFTSHLMIKYNLSIKDLNKLKLLREFGAKLEKKLNLKGQTEKFIKIYNTPLISTYKPSNYNAKFFRNKLVDFKYFYKDMKQLEIKIKSKDLLKELRPDWWKESGGFFGEMYLKADNSIQGYDNINKDLEERTQREIDGLECFFDSKKDNINIKILDAPCGYGRHSIELAKRGYTIKGVDINSFFLNLAKENGKKFTKEKNLSFRHLDLRKINYKNEFDYLINMFYSFGFFKNEAENIKVLELFYDALKKNGKFILHTHIFQERYFSKNLKEYEIRKLTNNSELELSRKYDSNSKREIGTWRILKDNIVLKKSDYSMRIYSKEDYDELLKSVGFSSINFYSDWSQNEFKNSSKLMIIEAIK